jgi:hypothetical protein
LSVENSLPYWRLARCQPVVRHYIDWLDRLLTPAVDVAIVANQA